MTNKENKQSGNKNPQVEELKEEELDLVVGALPPNPLGGGKVQFQMSSLNVKIEGKGVVPLFKATTNNSAAGSTVAKSQTKEITEEDSNSNENDSNDD